MPCPFLYFFHSCTAINQQTNVEYNVKRALGIDCGEDEIEMGISEVRETMEHIVYYHGVKDKNF